MRTGWDMDPFIVIKHGDAIYRTKVIRHDLNPTFGDKFILFLRPSAVETPSPEAPPMISNSTVAFSLMDWERISKDTHVGDAVWDVTSLVNLAPKADPDTGLYSEEAMRLHGFEEIKLPLHLSHKKERWEGQSSPAILLRYSSSSNIGSVLLTTFAGQSMILTTP
jgi:phosphatidylserine decarboxylase